MQIRSTSAKQSLAPEAAFGDVRGYIQATSQIGNSVASFGAALEGRRRKAEATGVASAVSMYDREVSERSAQIQEHLRRNEVDKAAELENQFRDQMDPDSPNFKGLNSYRDRGDRALNEEMVSSAIPGMRSKYVSTSQQLSVAAEVQMTLHEAQKIAKGSGDFANQIISSSQPYTPDGLSVDPASTFVDAISGVLADNPYEFLSPAAANREMAKLRTQANAVVDDFYRKQGSATDQTFSAAAIQNLHESIRSAENLPPEWKEDLISRTPIEKGSPIYGQALGKMNRGFNLMLSGVGDSSRNKRIEMQSSLNDIVRMGSDSEAQRAKDQLEALAVLDGFKKDPAAALRAAINPKSQPLGDLAESGNPHTSALQGYLNNQAQTYAAAVQSGNELAVVEMLAPASAELGRELMSQLMNPQVDPAQVATTAAAYDERYENLRDQHPDIFAPFSDISIPGFQLIADQGPENLFIEHDVATIQGVFNNLRTAYGARLSYRTRDIRQNPDASPEARSTSALLNLYELAEEQFKGPFMELASSYYTTADTEASLLKDTPQAYQAVSTIRQDTDPNGFFDVRRLVSTSDEVSADLLGKLYWHSATKEANANPAIKPAHFIEKMEAMAASIGTPITSKGGVELLIRKDAQFEHGIQFGTRVGAFFSQNFLGGTDKTAEDLADAAVYIFEDAIRNQTPNIQDTELAPFQESPNQFTQVLDSPKLERVANVIHKALREKHSVERIYDMLLDGSDSQGNPMYRIAPMPDFDKDLGGWIYPMEISRQIMEAEDLDALFIKDWRRTVQFNDHQVALDQATGKPLVYLREDELLTRAKNLRKKPAILKMIPDFTPLTAPAIR